MPLCLRCNAVFEQRTHGKVQKFCSRKCACCYRAAQKRERYKAAGLYSNQREAKTVLLSVLASCGSCGYDEHVEILEIHHKDRDRKNNSITNLELLCPNCHTWHHLQEGTGQFANNKGRNPASDGERTEDNGVDA